jgi:hypothetical protein
MEIDLTTFLTGDELQENATSAGAGTDVIITQATLMWDAPKRLVEKPKDNLKRQKEFRRSALLWKRVCAPLPLR